MRIRSFHVNRRYTATGIDLLTIRWVAKQLLDKNLNDKQTKELGKTLAVALDSLLKVEK
jgi:hypothetical protein